MTIVSNVPLIYAPFKGIYPKKEKASLVIAPPYDVLSSKEAKEKANNNPLSFLHISKAEIDFADDTSPYEEKVYQKAAENFNRLMTDKVLCQSAKPCYYVYQIKTPSHTQTGLAVAASVNAYQQGRIKRHELTRIAKEDDRVKQIRSVGAQTGPALLINQPIAKIKDLLARITTTTAPLFSALGEYNSVHSLWEIADKADIDLITTAFSEQNQAYIADGHHRSAAAARLANNDNARFLAVAFFADEMEIMDYNRVVYDLNGLSESEFLDKLKAQGFEVTPTQQEKPTKKGEFTLYLNHTWYKLTLKQPIVTTNPVERLDVSVLSALVLDNILNITDLRNSPRIDFIGGIRGAEEIKKEVDKEPNRAGFMLYPTQIEELIAVADEKMLMPPKSTWFEPKLADGVICLKPED
ncbi:MAG: DUF1015 domain-containing protein [Alphaproteobacteria bacterium]|nr:DUF1015 domain-containing protein [Alphaproteobacteria bacterium]